MLQKIWNALDTGFFLPPHIFRQNDCLEVGTSRPTTVFTKLTGK